MNKLYTLCAMVMLTACGGTPLGWDGEWQGVEDGVDNLTLKIMGISDTDAGKKMVLLFENGKMEEICKFENAQESEVEMRCSEDENFLMKIEGKKMTLSDDERQFTFVRVGDL